MGWDFEFILEIQWIVLLIGLGTGYERNKIIMGDS